MFARFEFCRHCLVSVDAVERVHREAFNSLKTNSICFRSTGEALFLLPCIYEFMRHNCKDPSSDTPQVSRLFEQFPAVAILGPRQVGKATLATALAEAVGEPARYLDQFR